MIQNNFASLQDADIRFIISTKLEYLFNIMGRDVGSDKLSAYVNELSKQLPRRFPWLSEKLLEEIVSLGASGELGEVKFFDLKMFIGWIYKFSGLSDEIKERILYSTPPIATEAKDSEFDYNWHAEVNKTFYLYKNGFNYKLIHHCVYDRMMLDDLITLNAYLDVMKEAAAEVGAGDTMTIVRAAKRICIKRYFDYLISRNVRRIYNLDRFKTTA